MEYVLQIIGLPQNSLRKAFSPLASLASHIYDHFIPRARNNYHPHILGHRTLGLFSGLLVAVKIFTLAVLSFGPVIPAFSSAITVQNIISLTNESRQAASLGRLSENSLLDKAAQSKANDMLAKGYFAHNSPDGSTPWDFITKAGYSYLQAGENLAVNFTEAENVESAWMNSPGHKANILNKNFEQIGIGIAEGQYQGHTAIFVVQMFGTPVEQKVSIQSTPTQVVPTPAPAPPVAQPQTTIVKSASTPKTVAKPVAPKIPEPVSPAPVVVAQGPAPQAEPEKITLDKGDVKLGDKTVIINATVTGPVVKVLAYFGEKAVMLKPLENGLWQGEVLAAELAQSNQTVRLEAFGMQGQSARLQLADFSSGTVQNYNLSGTTPQNFTKVLGVSFNPKSAEGKFYLFFIAGLLTSLIIAIGVKRHIQHLSLIANSSFVVILASLLFWAG